MGSQLEIWWFSAGLLLIIADLLVGSFFLLFLGVGALITGTSIMFDVNSISVHWVIFAVSSSILAMVFRKPLMHRYGPGSAQKYNEHQGEWIEIVEEENKSHSAKAKYKGSSWNVKSISGKNLKHGDKLQILRMEGISIIVE